jgi:hypothetical protein
MTNVFRWPGMTWVLLLLWSGYVATWTVITAAGPVLAGLWWVAGMIVLGSLWLATQPLFQPGAWRDAR